MVTTPLSPLPGPQPSLSPAQQHLESPVPSAPEALAGGPTQAAPGVRVEEEEWAREIGAQLRRMADDLNAQYERRVSAVGGQVGRGPHAPARCAAAVGPARAGSRRGQADGGVGEGIAWMPGSSVVGAGPEPQAGSGNAAPCPQPRGLRAALGAPAPISRAIYSR